MKAAWQEAVANYRSTFLVAVREVDDALLETQSLRREHDIQIEAVSAAEETSEIARLRHERGLASYFEVVDAERFIIDALVQCRTEAQCDVVAWIVDGQGHAMDLVRSVGRGAECQTAKAICDGCE